MRPSIEICAAGLLWMFHSGSALTSAHGGGGAPYSRCRRWRRRCFSLSTWSRASATSPSTASDSISRNAARYAWSSRRARRPIAAEGVLGIGAVGVENGGGVGRCVGPGGATLRLG